MSVIGEQIKKYRIEKELTQDGLGQMLNVTTQAVSRWERGGTPDAEMLPQISNALGVSIDALFGREEQNLPLTFSRLLSHMKGEEAYRCAMNMCWAIEVGLIGDSEAIDDFMNKFLDRSMKVHGKSKDYYAKIVDDNGMSLMRMSPDFDHFFLLSEADNGKITERLSNPESIRQVFEMLSDEKMLRIIYYMYSLPNIPIAASLISEKTNIDSREVERYMEKLGERNFVTAGVVATAQGEMRTYTFRRESYFIPLLFFADEIASGKSRPFFGSFSRTKPFL
ncbi:MAG: helix-turn-helix transcriptional regulator [Clostridia bacterium]|nr:helix-turn-helix transcriptional regulator [Clostridia bacterium]